MPDNQAIKAHASSFLTVYLRPWDCAGRTWFARLWARPTYMELLVRAKAFGIEHAVVHRSLAGYSHKRRIQTDNDEIPNPCN